MILFQEIYSVIAIISLAVMIYQFTRLSISHGSLKRSILLVLQVGITAVAIHSAFVFSNLYYMAFFCETLFFISMTWLTFAMLHFSVVYTETRPKFVIELILIAACLGDTCSLFANLFTRHSFDLTLMRWGATGQFWAAEMTRFHYIHLGLCYAMVLSAFFLISRAAYRTPSIYKKKYTYVLYAYVLVILLDFVCYSMRLPVDFSVLFYTVVAGFICHSATYSFPKNLVTFLLDNVNEDIDDGILFFDNDGKASYWNSAARSLLGGESEAEFKSLAAAYSEAWTSIHPEEEKNGRDSFIIDGEEKHYTVEYETLTADGVKVGSFFKFMDKTEETKLYLRHRFAATHDELTGILNRAGFLEAVEEAQRRHGDQGKDSFLMLASNIMDFKLVNSLFGDKTGDEILRSMARMMEENSHPETIFGRIGDDRFAMYLRKDHFDKDVFVRCLSELSKIVGDSNYSLRVKIGVYETSPLSESPQVMCDKAQMACELLANDYQNMFRRYDSTLMDRIMNERSVSNGFDSAISGGQFRMYLQPQISVDSDGARRCVGAEALVRWEHPKRGLLEPKDFLGVLEKSSQICALDQFVWDQAARTVALWRKCGFGEIPISVNVCPKDMFYIDVCQCLLSIAEKHGISPSLLPVEIHETGFMRTFGDSKRLLEELQSNAFKVQIDDFGSGYSSLNMLKDINADALKIGRSLSAETHGRSATILKTILAMAGSLGMGAVAVGVENATQLDFLRSLGCSRFQGFHFSPALSVEEFEEKFFKKPGENGG